MSKPATSLIVKDLTRYINVTGLRQGYDPASRLVALPFTLIRRQFIFLVLIGFVLVLFFLLKG
jgi:hypothetical protein